MEKTALGATASVSWTYCERTEDAVMHCRNTLADVFAVEQTLHSMMLQDFKTQVNYSPTKRLTLIFGHEVLGIQQSVIDTCDGVIEIPQYGTKHSLNIAVSTGIVLWELLRRP
jgi:tRNA G18 (ribose-2'-O)-methylase SpoU